MRSFKKEKPQYLTGENLLVACAMKIYTGELLNEYAYYIKSC